jgi:tetratricopeptide (TPR) repeat protein
MMDRKAMIHSNKHSAPLVAFLAALALCSPALAGASDDGNAGLQALNRGAYDEAIRDFTRALNSGTLASEDQAFAYYNRAQAYYNKQMYGRAIADLKEAVRLKPDDADAQSGLQLAVSKVVDVSGVAPPHENISGIFGDLGKALVSGAVAGIQQGLQDAAQGQSGQPQ